MVIVILTILASSVGIFSDNGNGNYLYQSIRGEEVVIHGKGLYRHMSTEVAIQGIAQDYITLFFAIPFLLISFYFSRNGSIRWRMIFTGALIYIFITYLFYMLMAMYNSYFLVYTIIMGASFFAIVKIFLSFKIDELSGIINLRYTKIPGWFLIFNAVCISFLWLNKIIPPLLSGEIYPANLDHYTTLVVQGLDLGIFLPLSFASGYLLLKKDSLGFLIAPLYLVFLSLQMIALFAKILYMGFLNYNIFPVIVIIPILGLVSFFCLYLLLQENICQSKIA